jgi:hypothetical protein
MKYNCGWYEDQWLYLGAGRTEEDYNSLARELCEEAVRYDNNWRYDLVEVPPKDVLIKEINNARQRAINALKSVEVYKKILKDIQ